MYEYKIKFLRVIDGDTLEALVDLGMNRWSRERLRLAHIDTPEIWRGDDRARGKEARDFVKDTLQEYLTKELSLYEHLETHDAIIRTEKEGSFGRFIAEVILSDRGNVTLADLLKTAGLEK